MFANALYDDDFTRLFTFAVTMPLISLVEVSLVLWYSILVNVSEGMYFSTSALFPKNGSASITRSSLASSLSHNRLTILLTQVPLFCPVTIGVSVDFPRGPVAKISSVVEFLPNILLFLICLRARLKLFGVSISIASLSYMSDFHFAANARSFSVGL